MKSTVALLLLSINAVIASYPIEKVRNINENNMLICSAWFYKLFESEWFDE